MRYYLIVLLTFAVCSIANSQNIQLTRKIAWAEKTSEKLYFENDSSSVKSASILTFENAVYENVNTMLPYYFELIEIPQSTEIATIELSNTIFDLLNKKELINIQFLDSILPSIELNYNVFNAREKKYLQLTFLPFKRNKSNQNIEKLNQFTIKIELKTSSKPKSACRFAEQSVLRSGKWIKFKVTQNGVYGFTFNELQQAGISNPQNIRIFGYAGRMLPLFNYEFRYDDLVENRIWFDNQTVRFYAEGTTQIKYSDANQFFSQILHLYADSATYFMTSDYDSGFDNLMQTDSLPAQPVNKIITQFDEIQYLEVDSLNLIQSGRQWFWTVFDKQTEYNFKFVCPNISKNEAFSLKTNMVARSMEESSFSVKCGNLNQTITIPVITADYTSPYAQSQSTQYQISAPISDTISVTITYNKANTSSRGWLDFLTINTLRDLIKVNHQFSFRSMESLGWGNVSQFNLQSVEPSTLVWDVTNPIDCKQISTVLNNGNLQFVVATDSLRQFIAFDTAAYLHPTIVGEVPNQNLHSMIGCKFLIIANPYFLEQANQLAEFHRVTDNCTVQVVSTEQIYNEFSSGTRDAAAIRDFVRMIYFRPTSIDTLRYLLLFGDGSHDNRSQTAVNPNFIPTYQSENSLSPTASYVTDDFFGLLDDIEGAAVGLIDVGIGRFPVRTHAEAKNILDKINDYTTTSSLGAWRNNLYFLGDDEDTYTYQDQSEKLARLIDTTHTEFNVNKIYLDAYPQPATVLGIHSPQATQTLNEAINNGMLIINYIGHGNEISLTHERILTTNDIFSWKNRYRNPIFITATCEFSRFDDYRTSAGELILLSRYGAIALYTTTRLVYSSPNFVLNKNFFKYAFRLDYNSQNYHLGDIMRLTKYYSGSSSNKLNFSLLGDPALKLAYPRNRIFLDSIQNHHIDYENNIAISEFDTLRALQMVSFSGHIADKKGNKLPNYTGKLYYTLFDKPTEIWTFGDHGLIPKTFKNREHILYQGVASVSNGSFVCQFIVPKILAYQIDTAKLSFYATDSIDDANGFYQRIYVGGEFQNANTDLQGPEVQVVVNSTESDSIQSFTVNLHDQSGICTASELGHEMIGILDNNLRKEISLNENFNPTPNNYKSGVINFKINDLSNGYHTLTLKVWDIAGNSTTTEKVFFVNHRKALIVSRIFNNPNPFQGETQFFFEHNQLKTDFSVEITIFTLSGKIVKSIQSNIYSETNISPAIAWNGTDNAGNAVAKGLYLYRIKVSLTNNESAEMLEKLLISD